MKRYIGLICVILVFVVVVLFLYMGYSYSGDVTLKKYDIQISSSDSLSFVTDKNVEEWLYSENCEAHLGVDMKNIDIRRIERFLADQCFVSNVNVTKDIFGTLFVQIEQAEPLFRVLDYEGNDFYVDKKLKTHSYDGDFVKDVTVVTCDTLLSKEIQNYAKKTAKNCNILDKFFTFVNSVNCSEFWNAQIAGINIEALGDVEIYPRFGSHKIILCRFEDIGDFGVYLRKLNVFYEQQIDKSGWNTYSQIDLSYHDMVVCKLRKK
ncbi:MAG: hypothetical protein R3Y26_00955 [Rikenellaceae bacterium]